MKIKTKLLLFILSIIAVMTTALTLGYVGVSHYQGSFNNRIIDETATEIDGVISEESADIFEGFGDIIVQKEINVIEGYLSYISGRILLQAEYMEEHYAQGMDEEAMLSIADNAWDDFDSRADVSINTFIITASGKVITLTGEPVATNVDTKTDSNYILGASGYGEPMVSKVLTDDKGNKFCSVAVCYEDNSGKVAGVVVSQIPFEMFESAMKNSAIGDHGKTLVVIDKDGYTPENVFGDDILTSDKWKQTLSDIVDNRNGSAWVTLGDQEYCIIYKQCISTDWILCSLISSEDVARQSDSVKENLNETTAQMEDGLEFVRGLMLLVIVALVAIIIIITVIIVFRLSKSFVKPIHNLLDGVKKISSGDLDVVLEATTKDEIGELTDAYNGMTSALKQHMEEIKDMAAAEEKSRAEMELAATVQRGMLPAAALDDEYIKAEGYNKPAKALGGDFYDHFYIDDSHVAIIIADVSDKGIPAALFMTNGRLLLRESIMNSESVDKGLKLANDILSRNNENLQFITAFVCLIDIRNGHVDYVNAGHDLPLIRRPDGSVSKIEADSGVPLGLMEGFEFLKYEMELKEGDQIFLYTDGVEDCVNPEGEHYSNKRMVEAVRNGGEDILSGLLEELKEFSKGADQFDDITMLGFVMKKYKK